MNSRTEKKIEKQLDRADKHHEKATVAEAKGHLHSADRHENKALNYEIKADNLAHQVVGLPAGGPTPYTGLNFPYSGATSHPTYGYQRLPRDKKAERFEAKAVEWEKRGDLAKAHKNRDKALRHRQRLQPGYVPTPYAQPYYADKANRLEQRAIRYQQLGLTAQAQRYQQRALRTRTKHGITGVVGTGLAGGVPLSNQYGLSNQTLNNGAYIGPITPLNAGTSSYQGLDYPYTGTTQHPTFGYSKMTSVQKAQRFDAKAAEWEKRGNLVKAQKNREKANRYRQMNQAGYAKPTRAQNYYIDRASHFDQKAIQYQQQGRNSQALRAQQRAQRIRSKHNIPSSGVAGAGFGSGLGGNQNFGAGNQNFGNQNFGQYQGLNMPYTGASNHPTYGYPRYSRDQKFQRYEAKAAEWERRGNQAKAQKNRDKALRYRQAAQPGYVRPSRAQNYYAERALQYDQKAARYQQWGKVQQAQRYQGRAQRIRAKHNIPATGLAGAGYGAGSNQTWTTGTTAVGPLVPAGTTYSGLNFPYTGAAVHPNYGYQRLPHNRKAERFEAKAAEWERRGNLAKAQKNRDKALRYRARSQPGYVAPVRPQTYYVQRAGLFDQKANQYQQWGMQPQAQRYQGRSQRIRAKHNLTAYPVNTGFANTGATGAYPSNTGFANTGATGAYPSNTGFANTGATGAYPSNTGFANTGATGAYPTGATRNTYSGLNFPYTGATTHPTYGYQRLPRDRKAERFELKAAEWERRGNLKKSTKNREKALRIRQRNQPNYVAPVRPQTYYVQRASQFDQKANQYQQWGMQPQAVRYQQRASRVRGKYNIPNNNTSAPLYTANTGIAPVQTRLV